MFNQLISWKLLYLFLVFGNVKEIASLGLGTLTESLTDVVGTLNSGVGSPVVSTLIKPLYSIYKQTHSLALVPSLLQYNKIDTDLLDALQDGESDALVYYNGVDEVIQSLESLDHSTLEEKRSALVEALQLNAEAEHATTKTALEILGFDNYYSSFGENCIVLEKPSLDVIYVLCMLQHVTSIQKPPVLSAFPPVSNDFKTEEAQVLDQFPNWGIPKIKAPEAWNYAKGKGVVIGCIDTGVRWTHEALKNNWRRENGWHDPVGNRKEPVDEWGHGTHIMGILVGQTRNIGGSPESQWIHCRGYKAQTFEMSKILNCADWMLNLKAKGPDVLSLSFGITGKGVRSFMENTLKAMKSAEILVAIAYGNNGPSCSSGGSPADQKPAFAVGSIDKDGALSNFSSLGPESEILNGKLSPPYIKPDIVGPGGLMYSAVHTGDNQYANLGGTSQAAPHVASTMALVLSYARTKNFFRLSPDTMTNLLKRSTTKSGLNLRHHLNLPICQTPGNPNLNPTHQFPNCYFGHGLVNALDAIELFIKDSNKRP